MNTNYLHIPLSIEVLVSEKPQQISPSFTDFSKLPWSDGTKDFNYDQPYLGDRITHVPFSDGSGPELPAGAHLHFILPHYLRQAISANPDLPSSGKLPPAPNRWLISKKQQEQTVKQWIIESDHIHSGDDPSPFLSAMIPASKGKPYRYMGRTTTLTEDRPGGSSFASMSGSPLTADGYGDRNFSSYYPNCMGVFGFHDPEGSYDHSVYAVLGWNHQPQDDLLYSTIQKLLTQKQTNSHALTAFVAQYFNVHIHVDDIDQDNLPRTIFYGEVQCDAPATKPDPSNISVATGHSGTAALSAWSASKLSDNPSERPLIEEQMASLSVLSKLDHLSVDAGPKLLEARHEQGFKPSDGGTLWQIHSEGSWIPDPAPPLATLLHEINILQSQYDHAQSQIAALKQQLYLDWCKYMQAAYPSLEEQGQIPDPDHIRHFIETHLIPEIQQIEAKTGSLSYGNPVTSYEPVAAATDSQDDLAHQITHTWHQIQVMLEGQQTDNNPMKLLQIPGPNFWEAQEPMVLITGLSQDSEKSTFKSDSLMATLLSSPQAIHEIDLATMKPGDLLSQLSGFNRRKLSNQSWKPFLLDWEIELTNLICPDTGHAFDPLTLKSNSDLDPHGPDFKMEHGQPGKASLFSGTAIIENHALATWSSQLESFIALTLKKEGILVDRDQLLDFLRAPDWGTACKSLLNTQGQASDAVSALEKETDLSKKPLLTAWKAQSVLAKTSVISQTLNGFNHVCALRKKTVPLAMKDPLGFPDAQQFTARISQLVGQHQTLSPLVKEDFYPIRSGPFTINRLRLTNTFGQPEELNLQQVHQAAETCMDGHNHLLLKPRLAQPARLNFQWLNAQASCNTKDLESNNHPDTSPVCGWLKLINADNTLHVYDHDGRALGYVGPHATWEALPWHQHTPQVETDIKNDHLRKVIQWILLAYRHSSQATKISSFLYTLKMTLDHTAPVVATRFNANALLTGRPMAVVRSQIEFQVRGIAIQNQSWPSLLTDLNNSDLKSAYQHLDRDLSQWTEMKLPVRIGEHRQLNDGLISYWVEDEDGHLESSMMAPVSSDETKKDLSREAFTDGNNPTQWLSLNDPPLKLTMLIDPSGVVHATTGLLPVKSISLPHHHFRMALQRLNIWFKSTALLQSNTSNHKQIARDLPSVPDHIWQWWDPANGTLNIEPEGSQQSPSESQLIDGWFYLIPEPGE